MISIMQAVEEIVNESEFAKEGLSRGLLNISAYAKSIHSQVEMITKKDIQNASGIIMALSRYSKVLKQRDRVGVDLAIHNIVSRSGLVEIAYTKTNVVKEKLATLYLQESIRSAPFFVATVGLAETSIITDASLADIVLDHFGAIEPLIRIDNLASLTMQVGIETVDMPGQSHAVLSQLAVREITVVEYTTSPTELNVILYEKDIATAFRYLHDKFLVPKDHSK